MPIVTLHLWPGRTPETKSKIIKAITHSLSAAPSIPPFVVRVLLIEVRLQNWGTAGVPASERAPEE